MMLSGEGGFYGVYREAFTKIFDAEVTYGSVKSNDHNYTFGQEAFITKEVLQ